MNDSVIFLIGPQGSGKGTQGKLLAKTLGFFYWDMGAILREIKSQNTPLAEKVRVIDNGVLLSDEVLLEAIEEKLKTLPQNQGLIFDGVPRRIGQAEFLLSELKKQGRKIFTSLYIMIPEEETLKRLLARAKLENRADDTEDKIRFRLMQYHQDTVPVLDWLKQHTDFIQIDGMPEVETVHKDILSKLKTADAQN